MNLVQNRSVLLQDALKLPKLLAGVEHARVASAARIFSPMPSMRSFDFQFSGVRNYAFPKFADSTNESRQSVRGG